MIVVAAESSATTAAAAGVAPPRDTAAGPCKSDQRSIRECLEGENELSMTSTYILAVGERFNSSSN
jgi:urease alpha subunit